MLVIINADDLGKSQAVNDAIFNLMSSGLISSATIMANSPCVEDAAERARKFPEISSGIHLNITAFSPLSLSNDLNPILDENRNFTEKVILKRTNITRSLSNAIYSEFCSQVEKLQSLGIKISHIDSHEHIHTLPGIFPILKRLQKKYCLRRVRIARNIYMPDHKISKELFLKKKIYNFMLRHYYSTKTTSGFGDLLSFFENAKTNNLNCKTVEIMVHPGSEKFKNETAILKPFWNRKIPVDFKLINYNQLY